METTEYEGMIVPGKKLNAVLREFTPKGNILKLKGMALLLGIGSISANAHFPRLLTVHLVFQRIKGLHTWKLTIYYDRDHDLVLVDFEKPLAEKYGLERCPAPPHPEDYEMVPPVEQDLY